MKTLALLPAFYLAAISCLAAPRSISELLTYPQYLTEAYVPSIPAALEGMPNTDASTDIVMVADNFAPVKDIALLTQIDRPVHIVLCGAHYGMINADYLNIAYATKGSVHTIEHDLMDLYKLSEGETVDIDGMQFVLTDGEFHPVYRL